jgi:hypothetical protein
MLPDAVTFVALIVPVVILLDPVSVGCLPSIATLTSVYPAMFSIPDAVTFDALIVPVVMLLEPVSVGCFPSIAS